MPRDGSGVYTLPSGNPVVTNTLVQSVWANTTMADVAVQLNNVLTRDGVLAPVLPFKLVDGTVAAPGLGFTTEPGLGLFRPSASILSIAAVNAYVASFEASVAAAVDLQLWPRSAGGTKLILNTDVQGSANTTQLHIGQNATEGSITSVGVGTGVPKPLTLTASQINLVGLLPFLGSVNQGRLVKSGANVVLMPWSGNKISVNGKLYTIPAAGVSLPPTSLASLTALNVYVYDNGAGALAIEANTGARAVDATYGQQIKSGDPTRTLVGKVYLESGAFVDAINKRYVLSWANRVPTKIRSATSNTTAYATTTPLELNAADRAYFLSWAGLGVHLSTSGYCSNTVAANSCFSYPALNGVPSGPASAWIQVSGGIGSNVVYADDVTAEDLNYITQFVNVSAGTGTWTQCLNSGMVDM